MLATSLTFYHACSRVGLDNPGVPVVLGSCTKNEVIEVSVTVRPEVILAVAAPCPFPVEKYLSKTGCRFDGALPFLTSTDSSFTTRRRFTPQIQRKDRNAARNSSANSTGCSHAAK